MPGMKSESIIKQKSFAFAVRIVKLYQYLSEQKKEFILTQILQSNKSKDLLLVLKLISTAKQLKFDVLSDWFIVLFFHKGLQK